MSMEIKAALSNHLNIEQSDIHESDDGLLHYAGNTYAVGDDNKIYNYLIRMISLNANKYVRKLDNTKIILDLGLLSVKNIDNRYYELLDYITEDEIIKGISSGERSVKDFLITKIKKLKMLTDDSYVNKENFRKLKDDHNFTTDFTANNIFRDYLTEDDYQEYSKNAMEDSIKLLKENLSTLSEDAMKSIITAFSYKKATEQSQLAEVVTKYGADNLELVLLLMGSVEEFAQGFSKLKGSYASCLDKRGEVRLINSSSPVYICDVTGLF